MAWTAASAAKGAAAVHAKHGKGHLTARMLAADRANLAKGRAKRHSTHRGSHRKGAFKLPHKASKPVSRGNAAARRVIENNYFTLKSKMPLGDRRIAYHKTVKLTTKKVTGVNKKFVKEIGPGGYDRRTKWAHSYRHHTKKVLKPRASKGLRVQHWRSTKRFKMPR